jgi:hypothetical protein
MTRAVFPVFVRGMPPQAVKDLHATASCQVSPTFPRIGVQDGIALRVGDPSPARPVLDGLYPAHCRSG